MDPHANQLILPRHSKKIPSKLTNKGLYLLDMNHLLQISDGEEGSHTNAETFAQESHENDTAETSIRVVSDVRKVISCSVKKPCNMNMSNQTCPIKL